MGIDFYYLPTSTPCRSVLLLAKELGLELNLKRINHFEGEQLKAEYKALNPQHTIPTMNDNGFVLWESRAILQYLANKYAKGSSLYPEDPEKRATVDQRLFFDQGTLWQRFSDYYGPVTWRGADHYLKSNRDKFEEALGWLDGFLETCGGWAAGPEKTIADYALVVSVSTMATLPPDHMDLSKYKNVTQWLEKCKAEFKGYEEANGEGARTWGEHFASKSAGKEIR